MPCNRAHHETYQVVHSTTAYEPSQSFLSKTLLQWWLNFSFPNHLLFKFFSKSSGLGICSLIKYKADMQCLSNCLWHPWSYHLIRWGLNCSFVGEYMSPFTVELSLGNGNYIIYCLSKENIILILSKSHTTFVTNSQKKKLLLQLSYIRNCD